MRVPLAMARVRAIARSVLHAEGIRDALVSIAFVAPHAIARLNRDHIGHAGATNVIAFGFAGPGPVIGDIYIAPAVARRNARRFGVGVREELVRLVVHGVLHVVGREHPEGHARTVSPMWRRQEALVRRALRTA